MIIVDDHLALLAIAGSLPDLGQPGPVTTTYSFHYRLVRAVSDSARSGSLSRRQEASAAQNRVLRPPANRLLVLDPRRSVDEAVSVAIERGTNLLLAELVGAALHHRAAVRITPRNLGRTWAAVMEAAGVSFATVDV